ncbi:MAG: hypothetical protein NXH79_01825 [Rhodobacteraceae bacterium]|nr:hypothetical protein [Paracoccaceae bacterium]
MSTDPQDAPRNQANQTREEWRDHLARIGADHGFFDRVADRHSALFVQESDTLVVSFDRAERAFADTNDGMPMGFAAVKRRQLSLLSILSSGRTWFRDPDLYDFFDGLTEQGFFESFRRVVFLGIGPMCGFAACAFSKASPGASVLAAAPAATVSVDRAGFDQRFRAFRKFDFSNRYAYGPEAMQRAGKSFLIFDPYDPVTSAHAAQFQGSHIARVPIRWFGPEPQSFFDSGDITVPFLRFLARGTLNEARILDRYRDIRRNHPGYLMRLAEKAQARGQFDRAIVVARHGARATGAPEFDALLAALGAEPEAETTSASASADAV